MNSHMEHEDNIISTHIKIALFFLFLSCGLSIFTVSLFLSEEIAIIYLIILTSGFLLFSLFLYKKRRENLNRYALVFFSFFIACFVFLLQWYWGRPGTTIEIIIINKVISTILVVIPVILLIKISRQDMSSIYLKKGKLRLGLILGSIVFLFFLFTAFPASIGLFGGQEVSIEQLINLIPWILIFIFLNAFREEIWFRGLFLKRYETLLGKDKSNLVQAVIFAFAHLSLPFSLFTVIYLIFAFFLGLAFGAIMQKTDSLIAPILFHAGADIPVILAVFSYLI